MLSEIDNFYLRQKEPVKNCLLALRDIILAQDEQVSATWKYRMPFFCYHHKMFCYLWVDKKVQWPYLGIVEGQRLHHAHLLPEKRSRMKTMLFDPGKDLPADAIQTLLKQALDLYRLGIIPVKIKTQRNN